MVGTLDARLPTSSRAFITVDCDCGFHGGRVSERKAHPSIQARFFSAINSAPQQNTPWNIHREKQEEVVEK